MSFQVQGSGHCDTQEDFEAVLDAAQEAANAIGAHTNSPFTLTLNGTDHNHEAVSRTFTSGEGAGGAETPADVPPEAVDEGKPGEPGNL